MCDWNEQDPYCHVNSVSRFEKFTQESWNYAINTSYQTIITRSSCEVKNGLFRKKVNYALTSLFMCDPTYKIRPLTPDKPLGLWGVRDFL